MLVLEATMTGRGVVSIHLLGRCISTADVTFIWLPLYDILSIYSSVRGSVAPVSDHLSETAIRTIAL